jgi:glutamine cyclotransferase
LLGSAVIGTVVLVTLLHPHLSPARAQSLDYVVVGTFPHDPEAFTEGLAFSKGLLFEGTGDVSWLRKQVLETGEVKRQRNLATRHFGEGVTVIGDRVFQLTWTSERAFVYDKGTFERIRTFNYNEDDRRTEEGWGLADNGAQLAMSDGTDMIRFRSPRTFEVTREISVTENGDPVSSLNELEWIGDEIFANVFPGDDVVRIDAYTGEVTDRFSLAALHQQDSQEQGCGQEVTNGIAYLQSQGRFFVTGKYWCHIYEIQLANPPD